MTRSATIVAIALLLSACFEDAGNSVDRATDMRPWSGDTDGDTDGNTDGDTDGDTDTGNQLCGIEGLTDPGTVPAAAGDPVHHFVADTANGWDDMSLCELAGQPILLTTAVMWCPACADMALCFQGNLDRCWDNTDMEQVRDRLLANEAVIATIVMQDTNGSKAVSAEAMAAYYEDYRVPRGYMFFDPFDAGSTWLPNPSYPHIVSIDREFRYMTVGGRQTFTDIAYL